MTVPGDHFITFRVNNEQRNNIVGKYCIVKSWSYYSSLYIYIYIYDYHITCLFYLIYINIKFEIS